MSGSTPASLAPAAPAGVAAMTERELEILAFERQWWKYAGAKETAVRDLFDMSATRPTPMVCAAVRSDTPRSRAIVDTWSYADSISARSRSLTSSSDQK